MRMELGEFRDSVFEGEGNSLEEAQEAAEVWRRSRLAVMIVHQLPAAKRDRSKNQRWVNFSKGRGWDGNKRQRM